MAVTALCLVGMSATAAADEGPDLPVDQFEPPEPGAVRADAFPITFPVEGAVVFDDGFGHCRESDCSRRHAGFDLFADKLRPLLASTAGQVVFLRDEPLNNAGNYLILEGDDGIEYWYLHVNNDTPGTDDGLNPAEWRFAPGLAVGQRVAPGDFLAYLGDSGNAENTDSHLHFEMRTPTAAPDGLPDFDATPIDTAPSLFDAFSSRESLVPPTPPARAVHGDFDGDGDTDVIDYAAGPALDQMWTTDGSGVLTRSSLSIRGIYEPLVGDFDANGADDVFWYAAGTAPDYVWLGGPTGFVSRPIAVGGTYTPLVADFDGDGGDDIMWNAENVGTDSMWVGFRGDSRFESVRLTLPTGTRPLVGDFDGDRRADVFWYAPGSRPDEVWYGGSSFAKVTMQVRGAYQPLVGDFTGGGSDDIFWYRSGAGPDHLWSSAERGFGSTPMSVLGHYEPRTADFDGDGLTDILWRGLDGPDYVWTMGPTFRSSSVAINRTDAPVIGSFGGGPGHDLVWWSGNRQIFIDAPFGLLESALLFLAT